MGCALASMVKRQEQQQRGERDDAVLLCRERKRLVKRAVKQRQAFGEAHSRYLQSLSSVSAAIALIIARYSSPQSHFLITFSSSSDSAPQQPPNFPPQSPNSNEAQSGVVCDDDDDDYGSMEGNVKWDFFDLLDREGGSEGLKVGEKKVKKEGKGEKGGVNEKEMKSGKGRELLEALKDLEDHFMRAYECGLDVSRMLEVNKVLPQPCLEDIKDNSFRKRSISSRSSSCQSLLSSSSKSSSSTWAESRGDSKSLVSSSSDNSSTWTEKRSDLIDGCWGMVSGSHSFTLGRLYAWEKKLYHEVKAGDQNRRTYNQKCCQLRKKDAAGDELFPSKAASEVTDLYHTMLVAFQRAESISKQIEKLRDEELQPQLVELLHGLMKTWKMMLESHEIQKKIMLEVNSFCSPDQGKYCNESHRLALLQLEAAIQNWNSCLSDYISLQKAYIKSLHGWLSKFINGEAEYYYKDTSSLRPIRFNGPTLILICRNWLTSLERLPDKAVKNAMKALEKDIKALWDQQGKEQQLKRKVDGLGKEMDKKILAFKKDQVESSLEEKKNQLEILRKRLEMEKQRHHCSVQETQRVTLNALQMGFSSVFESLIDFSRASIKIYADLFTFSQNSKV